MLCAVARTGLYSCYMILAIVFEMAVPIYKLIFLRQNKYATFC